MVKYPIYLEDGGDLKKETVWGEAMRFDTAHDNFDLLKKLSLPFYHCFAHFLL